MFEPLWVPITLQVPLGNDVSAAHKGKRVEVPKSLGTLSPEQLAGVLDTLREVNSWGGVLGLLKQKPRLERLIAHPDVFFYWAWAYELPLALLVALLGYAMAGPEAFKSVLAAEDKQEAVLKLDQAPEFEPPKGRVKAGQALLVIALLQALFKSLECIQQYSEPMSVLVERAGSGDREALRNLVRIDPSAIASPTVAKVISVAVMNGDRKLLKAVKGAFDSPRVALAPYRELRFTEVVLAEAGAFASASREHIFEIVANKLGLYEQKKGDPFKGLFTFFDRAKQKRATT